MHENRQNPLVSVVCLTYNQEAFVTKALEGFLLQRTSFPFEIIVHDDASTDATPAILATYAAKHPELFRIILQSENQYSRGVRMPALAFAASRGKYIAYCEGDDFWTHPDKLQMQVDLMESRPEVGLVFTDKNVLWQERQVLVPDYDASTKNIVPVGKVLKSLLLSNPYTTCTSLFRSDLVAGYETTARALRAKMDDVVMWLTIIQSADVEYIPLATATYRIQQESASHSRSIYKNVRYLRSGARVSRYFNLAFGGYLPEPVLDDRHRLKMLDCSIRFHMWRSAANRSASFVEFARHVGMYLARQVLSHFPSCYRLAKFGRSSALGAKP